MGLAGSVRPADLERIDLGGAAQSEGQRLFGRRKVRLAAGDFAGLAPTGDGGSPENPDSRATPFSLPPGEPPVSSSVPVLGNEQFGLLQTALGREPPGSPGWFAVLESDPSARELGQVLRDAFERAGWAVRGTSPIPFTVKPGVFVFAADDEPPAHVAAARDALQQAGLPVTLATGYRAYSMEMRRTRPGWQGFDLAADQTYVIVIGPVKVAS